MTEKNEKPIEEARTRVQLARHSCPALRGPSIRVLLLGRHGLPARLALSASEPTSLAEAKPLQPTDALVAEAAAGPSPDAQALAAAQPVAEPVAPAPPANAEQTVQASLTADAAFAKAAAEAAPMIHASADPMREAVMKRLADPIMASKEEARTAFANPRNLALVQPKAAPGLHGGSDWVVQIGAYNSSQSAAAAWARAKGKSLEQRGYHRIGGQLSLNGHVYHRLAMSGFGSRSAADQLCASLRSSGQTCFVRHDAGVANDIRMARMGKAEKTAQAAKPVVTKAVQTAKAAAKPVKTALSNKPAKIAISVDKPVKIAIK